MSGPSYLIIPVRDIPSRGYVHPGHSLRNDCSFQAGVHEIRCLFPKQPSPRFVVFKIVYCVVVICCFPKKKDYLMFIKFSYLKSLNDIKHIKLYLF